MKAKKKHKNLLGKVNNVNIYASNFFSSEKFGVTLTEFQTYRKVARM